MKVTHGQYLLGLFARPATYAVLNPVLPDLGDIRQLKHRLIITHSFKGQSQRSGVPVLNAPSYFTQLVVQISHFSFYPQHKSW